MAMTEVPNVRVSRPGCARSVGRARKLPYSCTLGQKKRIQRDRMMHRIMVYSQQYSLYSKTPSMTQTPEALNSMTFQAEVSAEKCQAPSGCKVLKNYPLWDIMYLWTYILTSMSLHYLYVFGTRLSSCVGTLWALSLGLTGTEFFL